MQDFAGSTRPRLFQVTVAPPVGGQGRSRTFTNLTALPGTKRLDTGPLHGAVDLTEFTNRIVRVSFDAVIQESSTGPALFELDNEALHDTNDVPRIMVLPAGLQLHEAARGVLR